jgi:hypothetical protein
MVDCKYVSRFQEFFDIFVKEVQNVVQVGRYHRFWMSVSGELHAIVVMPNSPSTHPEWPELFPAASLPQHNADILALRVLARKIGYFIVEVEKGRKFP